MTSQKCYSNVLTTVYFTNYYENHLPVELVGLNFLIADPPTLFYTT